MLRFLRNETARRTIVCGALAIFGGLAYLVDHDFSLGGAATTLVGVAVGIAALVGLVAWREVRNPLASFEGQAAAALGSDEQIRFVTSCVCHTGGELHGTIGGVAWPVIVCLTDRRLAVIRPAARVIRTKPPKLRLSTESSSVRGLKLGKDIFNSVPVTTVELKLKLELDRWAGHYSFGFVKTHDAERLFAALEEWAAMAAPSAG
jgi:hypothetical protein